jgi:AraC-like DNA-binding protein
MGPVDRLSRGPVLYDPRMSLSQRRPSGPEWVRAWKPAVTGVCEVFHARFVDYAYPPHVHDSWTVFVVDDGWIRYDLETRHRGAGGRRVTILPPNVVHDGRAAVAAGFRKRVLYLTTDILDERLTGRAADRPDIADPALLHAVHALHRSLRHPDDALEAESYLATVGDRLRIHLGDPSPTLDGPRAREDDRFPPDPDDRALTNLGDRSLGHWERRLRARQGNSPGLRDEHARRLAGELRDLLDGRLFEQLTLAQAGRDLGASPGHLVRSFTRSFGIAPHQYVLARRIDAARHRLLTGESIARVASSVGFYDQAHFTRQFRRHVGTPPGRYLRSAAG